MAPKFDVYAHVTETIIAEIEAGTPPWHKPWSGSASGIALPTRHNGEEYRGINILMLWVMAAKHGYVSSRWMTYKQAQELGGQVRKGETSSTVVKYGTVSYRIVAEEMRSIKKKMKHEKASYYKTHGLRKNATIELYLAGCDDEMVKAVTGHSGVEMLKKYGGPIRQRELAKRAQEARNQMERSKTET